MNNSSPILPLQGIKILDLTRLLPGPFATQYLADLGAEVLRVESPAPDLARFSPPFINNHGTFDVSLNRNKKSILINLKDEKGKLIFYQLVKDYDVLIEQFRPGVVSKLQIDYESIKVIKPDILYCSLSGYGQNGPYRDKPGHDINYLSEAGFFNDQLNNDRNEFQVPQVPIADLAGSFSTVIAVLSAIIQKNTTGQGLYLDVSMFDSIVSWLNGSLSSLSSINGIFKSFVQSTDYMLNGKKPYYRIYNTADYPISIGALEPHFWTELCKVLELDDFASQQLNESLHDQMINKIQTKLLTNTCAFWVKALQNACVAPVKKLSEIPYNPQLQHRQMFGTMLFDDKSEIKIINNPLFNTSKKLQTVISPPRPGEHTFEIMKNLGYSEQEIKELLNDKIIG